MINFKAVLDGAICAMQLTWLLFGFRSREIGLILSFGPFRAVRGREGEGLWAVSKSRAWHAPASPGTLDVFSE